MRKRAVIFARTLISILLVTAAVSATTFPEPTFELIGEVKIPSGAVFGDLAIGGLSGITYDPEADLYYVISDDRSRHDPARFFGVRIDVLDGQLSDGDVIFESVVTLRDEDGHEFAAGTIDPEGIAIDEDGTILISSEGVPDRAVQPFVRRFSTDGTMLESIPVPEHYLLSEDNNRGVRPNLGFEILGFAPGWNALFTASENALRQDGPAADVGKGSLARILEIDPRTRRSVREFVYPVEPVVDVPEPDDALRSNGLTDILVVDPRLLLTIERSYSAGHGFTIRLYLTSIEKADNVLGTPSLLEAGKDSIVYAEKKLVLDLANTSIVPDNIEGITFGPTLPDGRRVVILVADDNFNPPEQTTQFVAFAVSGLVAIHQPPVSIAAIQGRGHHSPMEDRWVDNVEGVVTAIWTNRDGEAAFFWIQEADDDDPATSAAVQVLQVGDRVEVEVGDRVEVSGRVNERAFEGELSVTRIDAFEVEITDKDQPIPTAIIMGVHGRVIPDRWTDNDGLTTFDPDEDTIDYFESLEGMRVQIDDAVVIGATSRYRTTAVLVDRGKGSEIRSLHGGLLMVGAAINPERLLIDTRLISLRPQLAVGEVMPGPSKGVLHYSYGSFRLYATEPLPEPEERHRVSEATTLTASKNHLTVATYNVENLAATKSQEHFDRVAKVISHNLGSPDVVMLQEIQDDSGRSNDGVVTAEKTLTRLTEAITAAGGATYRWRQADPADGSDGGQPGGNIRVVVLFNPDRISIADRGMPAEVTVVEGPHFEPNPGRIGLQNPAFAKVGDIGDGVRKPLAVELQFNGHTLFLVGVHMSSKLFDDRVFGSRQPPILKSEARRMKQACLLRSFAEQILTHDAAAKVMVLGDFNELDDRPPLLHLTAGNLTNLLLTLPRPDLYSHIFNGNSQTIDHILVSPALTENAEIDVVHCNVDLPASEQASDHDPVVARFYLP